MPPGAASDPFVLGVNYWPRRKAMYWWSNFDAGEVREEFATIRELGMSLVRIFLLWDDFQPAPDAVRIDGFMPEHNHGMNYKAVVKGGEGGRYLADGMMFHMPGRWDFIFEVRGGGKTDRMTATVMLQ